MCQLVKELLEQVSEQAHKIENAKLCAVGTRNLVSAEVETRPRILRDQHNIISDKQDQLQVQILYYFHGKKIIIINKYCHRLIFFQKKKKNTKKTRNIYNKLFR
jgi:hypothetical protein